MRVFVLVIHAALLYILMMDKIVLPSFLVDSISNQSGKKVSSLAVAELSHSNVKITGPVAVLKDIESNWVWDRSLGAQLTTPGSHVHPVNPDVSIPNK